MTKRAPAVAKDKSEPMAFTFGDPEPVLDRREVMDHIECWRNGKWYEPPVSLDGLARTFRASPHHSSAIWVKVNLLASTFIPSRYLSRKEFKALALDYCTMANGYLERRRSLGGGTLALVRSPARYTRRGIEPEEFFYLTHGGLGGLYGEHAFQKGDVCHLKVPDLSQEVYGVPEYLGALQSIFLNEAATIFRRRYYLNGSHAGFILYMTDASAQEGDIDDLRKALKESKGPGNFRNLFLYAPNGKKDGLQLIPVSEVAAKDEFLGIKNISRDDVLAAHRTPPQLLGVVPSNTGGFGDVGRAAGVFYINEIQPLQSVFLEINEWLGVEAVKFGPYDLSALSAPAGGPTS